ncbi:sensor histidine kinase [Actinomycetospora endophytica]|uniref:Sensor histidine kinase n=1 Tax=Actinomycetospora endophytica TaxID=2291215 RepID=A0ABS8PGE1_9PSEU|nr:sensor histidine kinase [Actinomycetospora endophytica]MCD2196074.1 sensor histidine kinase [Actinomycetospora endophytica]
MTVTSPADAGPVEQAPAGLVHAAVLCGDPDEVARRTEEHVRTALAADETVEVVLDRRGVRAFRDALGDDAERVAFPAPASLVPSGVLPHLDPLDGGVVVGRVCADDPGPDGSLAEDTLTLLLADHRLTVLCVYDPDDPVERARALRHHAWLLTAEGLRRNPDFRAPSATSPVPAGLLGSSVATLSVPDGAALAGLRHQVAVVAREAGLDPERAEAIVLAAHEAMLFASGADLRSDLLPGEHMLDVRVTPAAVVTECRGTPPSGTPLVPVEDPRFLHLRRFCDHATVHADREERLVRVLTGTTR